jgi:RimJ/RimL family protein N-acetyltransferase
MPVKPIAQTSHQTSIRKRGDRVLIREAVPDDAPQLIEYLNRVGGESDFLTFGADEFELSEAEEADFLRRCREDAGQVYFVAVVDDRIVGTLHFASGRRKRMSHSGEFGMSVGREQWGQGIGSLLLDALIEWAEAGGAVTKINLRVRSDNVRAIALYERKGFEREGLLRRGMRVDDVYYDLLAMGLCP